MNNLGNQFGKEKKVAPVLLTAEFGELNLLVRDYSILVGKRP